MKKRNRRIFSWLLAGALAANVSVATAFASDYQSNWAEPYLSRLVEQGVIRPAADGSVRPNDLITRAETAAMINRTFGFSETAAISYADVAESDWFYQDAAAAKAAGYMQGTGDGFQPTALITRQELCVAVAQAMGLTGGESAAQSFTDSGDIAAWAAPSVGAMASAGLLTGLPDGSMKPLANLTRAELAAILSRAMDAAEPTSSTVIVRNGEASDLLTVGTSSVTVKTGTTVDTLLSQIKAKDGTSQSYAVTDGNGAAKAVADAIADGDKLVVTSSNGKASFTNALYVKDALDPTKEYWDDETYSHIDETVNANTPVFKDVDYVVTSDKYMALVEDMEEVYNVDNGTEDSVDVRTQTVQDYTKAIQTAIDDATAAGGGRVVVPAAEGATAENPTVYYTGSIEIKSNVNLHIEENVVLKFVRNITNEYYPMVLTSFEGNDTYNYASPIRAFHARNIALTGKGTLDPQADNYNWWPWKKGTFGFPNQSEVVNVLVKDWSDNAYPVEYRLLNDGATPLPAQIPTMDIDWNDITKVTMIDTPTVDGEGNKIEPLKSLLRPCTVETYACENILIEGIKIVNSPMWEIHPLRSRNVLVRDVNVDSHGPNNDGVDPESTSYVVIENCAFNTGDDCIAIKSGKNRDGYARGQVGGEPSENLIVRNSVFADGHGGVTAGSECTGGVRNVFATDNHYDSVNLQQVLRFKTNSYRGGLIENIYFKDSTVAKASNALMYGETQYTAGSAQDKEGDLGPYTPQLKNVYMSNIVAGAPDSPVDAKNAIYYTAYERAPMTDIKVKDVTVYGVKNQFNLVNVKNFELENVQISLNTDTPNLTTYNTTPITLDSAKLTVNKTDYTLAEGAKVDLPADTDKTKTATISGVIETEDAQFADGKGTVKVYLDRGTVEEGDKRPIITPYDATVTDLGDGKYSFTVEVPLADKPDYQYAYRPDSEKENMLPGNHIVSIVATGEVYQQNTWNFSVQIPEG